MRLKIAHMSDLHYCSKHLEWVDRAFDAAVQDAIDSKADAAVISGDSFDAEIHLHAPAVDRLVSRIMTLAHYMPVLVLQGTCSHDRPGSLDVLKYLPGVAVADTASALWLTRDGFELRDGSAIPSNAVGLFTCLPSINRAEIRQVDGEHYADTIAAQFSAWREMNDQAREHGIPTVMVSHGTVNGCRTESKQSMVSPDHEFSTGTLFGAGADAVMLGHIHEHQSWVQQGRAIAYPGSITKLVYGHTSPTGYLLWEVEPHAASFALRSLPARQLIDIEFDGPPNLQELQQRLADCRGAWVRLRYQVDEEHRHSVDLDAIKTTLTAAGVGDFKIDGRINPVQRTRAAGINREESLASKLRRWCELTNTTPDPLIARLEQLQSGTYPGAPRHAS